MLHYDPALVYERSQSLGKKLPLELTGAFMAYCHKMVLDTRAHPVLVNRWGELEFTAV
jgi:hypothetical protein